MKLSLVCKKIKEETGAPLSLCLKALNHNDHDFEKALDWIRSQYSSSDFGYAKEYFRTFVVRGKGGIFYGQIMGSDTLLRTREISEVISNSFNHKEDFEKSLERISFAAREKIILKNWSFNEENSFQYYLHLQLDEFSCVGGAMLWQSNEEIEGEELHWAFNVTGQKGNLHLLNKGEITVSRTNKSLIEGGTSNKSLLSKISCLLILD